MKRFFILLLFLTLSFVRGHSQLWGTEIGIGSGISIYQGDLSPYWLGAYNKPNFSFQLNVQQNLLPFLAVRANYAYAPVRDNENNYEGGSTLR